MSVVNQPNLKVVKVVLSGDLRRIVLNQLSFDSLCQQIIATYHPNLAQSFIIKYKDEEEELITLSSDIELIQALSFAEQNNMKALKLHIILNQNSSPQSIFIPSISSTPILTPLASVPSTPISLVAPVVLVQAEVKEETKNEVKVEEKKDVKEEKKEEKKKNPKVELLYLFSSVLKDAKIQTVLPVLVDSVLSALIKDINTPTADLANLILKNEIVVQHPGLQQLLSLVPFPMLLPYFDLLRNCGAVPLSVEKIQTVIKPLVEHLLTQLPQLGDLVFRWAENLDKGGDADLEFDLHWGDRCCKKLNNDCIIASSNKQKCEKKCENSSSAPVDSGVHADVACDGCNMTPITGIRYKCCVCHNFDLCASCEASNSHNPAHPMLKIRPTNPNPNNEVHEGVTCDECNEVPIRGIRYKCNVCANFDLCSKCEAKSQHAINHAFIKIHPSNPLAFHRGWGGMKRGRCGMRRGGMGGFGRRMMRMMTEGGLFQDGGRGHCPPMTGGGFLANLLAKCQRQNESQQTKTAAQPATAPIISAAAPVVTPTASVPSTSLPNTSAPVSTVEEIKIAHKEVVTPPLPSADIPAKTVTTDKSVTPIPTPVISTPAPAPTPTVTLINPQPQPKLPPPKPTPKPHPLYSAQLDQLAEMGFTDTDLNVYLLQTNKGNVQSVCRWLLERQV